MSEKYIRVDDVVDFLRESAEGLHNTPAWATLLDECAGKIEQFPTYTPADILAGMWVPVTPETMPEEPYGCLLIVWDTPYDGGDDYLAYYPGFAGWDGAQWNDGDGQQVPFEVAYWMQLPDLPQPPKDADQ